MFKYFLMFKNDFFSFLTVSRQSFSFRHPYLWNIVRRIQFLVDVARKIEFFIWYVFLQTHFLFNSKFIFHKIVTRTLHNLHILYHCIICIIPHMKTI